MKKGPYTGILGMSKSSNGMIKWYLVDSITDLKLQKGQSSGFVRQKAGRLTSERGRNYY